MPDDLTGPTTAAARPATETIRQNADGEWKSDREERNPDA